jgi:hypothetical protein
MSEFKGTPGPWGISVDSTNIIKQFDFLGESNVIIGSASGYKGSAFFPTDEEAMHNARLIASAPELLEILNGIVVLCELNGEPIDGFEFRKRVITARAVIAKATGGLK